MSYVSLTIAASHLNLNLFRLQKQQLTADGNILGDRISGSGGELPNQYRTDAFPSFSGGSAAKVAELYERAWTVRSLLDVVSGEIAELRLEQRGAEGLGVEFCRILPNRDREYHSSKASSSSIFPEFGPFKRSPNHSLKPAGRSSAIFLGTLNSTILRTLSLSAKIACDTCGKFPRERVVQAIARSFTSPSLLSKKVRSIPK